MLIYTNEITDRLVYTLDFIFNDVLSSDYYLTDDESSFVSSSAKNKISYSKQNLGGIHITPSSLLSESEIKPQDISPGYWSELPTLFHNNNGDIPFDIFSSVFFLTSRYEEYLPSTKDKHGRFQAKESVAFKHNFLSRPIINEWSEKFSKKIGLKITDTKVFESIITIDIDNSYSYKGKGLKRSVLGLSRDILHLNLKSLKARINSFKNIEKDPSNSFNYIINSLTEFKKKIFFILNGDYNTFDKNLPLTSPAQKELIKKLAAKSEIGIHPSYQSNFEKGCLKKEINSLEEFIQKPIISSRQHFLMLEFPKTYQNLIRENILNDYTMGYAEAIGFRSSTCTPFYWFDLTKNKQSTLKIYSVGLMDGTLHDYLKLTPNDAVNEAKKQIDYFKKYNGTFVLIWHNTSFNEIEGWKEWKPVYEEILTHCKA